MFLCVKKYIMLNYVRKKESNLEYFFILITFNPLTTSVSHDIETRKLICNANQLTGSYIMENIGR